MILKTYFSGDNTLVSESSLNFGLNPVTYIFHGGNAYSRYIFRFDVAGIRKFLSDGTFGISGSLHHHVRLYNAAALDFRTFETPCGSEFSETPMKRAQSFDLVVFPLPASFDEGTGHDSTPGTWIGDRNISTEASNWFNRKNNKPWAKHCRMTSPGIYDNTFLQKQYTRYLNGEESIIITDCHFESGTENMDIDLTTCVNRILEYPNEFKNNGFCIALNPFIETGHTGERPRTVNFFTRNTSSFFRPYLLTHYDEHVSDDRADFYLDAPMNLVFYSGVLGEPVNLLHEPSCTVRGHYENGDAYVCPLKVKNVTRGVYSARILMESYRGEDRIIEPGSMFYDTWSDIEYLDIRTGCGINLQPVTLEFVTKSASGYYTVGTGENLPKQYDISINGIAEKEKIKRGNGERRRVGVSAVYKYTSEQSILNTLKYRIFYLDGENRIETMPWDTVNKSFTGNYFLLDVDSFLPGDYIVTFFLESRLETKNFDGVRFTVV
jgi:hypothetical protein